MRTDPRRMLRVFILAALLVLPACDSGTDGGPKDVVGSDLPVDGPGDVGHGEDLVAEAPYPDGPYGYTAGETVADLGFYDPGTGETLYLHQWYQDPKVKLLMLISTAAW
jgi:hypothetical protein